MDTEILLIAVSMILSSCPTRTVEFFSKIYPHLKDDNIGMTQRDMAEIYGCTPQAAKKHVDVLTVRGYLRRRHYRCWVVERPAVDTLAIRQIIKKVQ